MANNMKDIPQNQVDNLVNLLDAYFSDNGREGMSTAGQHLNVNIIQPEQLRRACEDPEHYGNLIVRISGYAVRVNALTDEQRKELLARTLHDSM